MAKGTCSVEGCERPVKARGWCNAHYLRWAKYGDPLAGRPPVAEMVNWVLDNYRSDPDGPCVVWPYTINDNGYGSAIKINGKQQGPHRHALELRDGPPSKGMLAIHGPCHNPACIIHVRWGTRAENAADMIRDGTSPRGERNWSTKLTPEDVREIRRMRAAGVPRHVVANQFGVCGTAVRHIVLRHSWAWVD